MPAIIPLPDFSVTAGQCDDASYMMRQGKPAYLFDPKSGEGELLRVKDVTRSSLDLEDGRSLVVRNLYASQKFHRADQWRKRERTRELRPYSSLRVFTEAVSAGCAPVFHDKSGKVSRKPPRPSDAEEPS